jgi:hypothetical protein
VTNRQHIGPATGGVQTCSREYLAVLGRAGFKIETLQVDVDPTPSARVGRMLVTSPYRGCIASKDLRRLESASAETDFIFLNQVNLAGGLPSLPRGAEVRKKTVLLSHGAEVTDLVHIARAKNTLPITARLRPSPTMALQTVFMDELKSRRGIAAAICLSAFDADFERWLGVPKATWLPRMVTPNPLDWKPQVNRFGFIGTLDHAPNLEGLVEVLRAAQNNSRQDFDIRVVGGPPRIGRWLSAEFKMVTYLGSLSEFQLVEEAASWSAFLNPIFCKARGCSTKLATGMAWEVPIVTTTIGRRGYVCNDQDLSVADSVADFIDTLRTLSDFDRLNAMREGVKRASRSAPTLRENAMRLRDFLGLGLAQDVPIPSRV